LGLSRIEHKHCKKIEPAIDRFQEAHYWIHMLEEHYHRADLFRWHLNVFLKAIKEVKDILQMNLQNLPNLLKFCKTERARLKANPLISALSKKRDFIVHQSRLVPNSKGIIGICDSTRKIRLGFGVPIDPLEDSDIAMMRYVEFLRQTGIEHDLILEPDEDTIPCIQREWRLPEFEDEIVSLCIVAWMELGQIITNALELLEDPHEGFSLDCRRHNKQTYTTKLYDREKLIDNVKRTGDEWLHQELIWIPSGRPTKSN
tara:strand:+ start:429 stop:1202 length:774 start_codon:yes stop_codon:yes gene_type:complete